MIGARQPSRLNYIWLQTAVYAIMGRSYLNMLWAKPAGVIANCELWIDEPFSTQERTEQRLFTLKKGLVFWTGMSNIKNYLWTVIFAIRFKMKKEGKKEVSSCRWNEHRGKILKESSCELKTSTKILWKKHTIFSCYQLPQAQWERERKKSSAMPPV